MFPANESAKPILGNCRVSQETEQGRVGWVRESLGEENGDWIMPLKELKLLLKAIG